MILSSSDDRMLAVQATTQMEDSGVAIYRLLISGSDPDAADLFDIHVTACILALAFWEAVMGQRSMADTTGLDPVDLAEVIDTMFPQAAYLFPSFAEVPPVRGADEDCLLDLLNQCASEDSAFQMWLARMVMTRHFRPLAARKTSDMKWKKFLYRMICRDTGYSICTAPSCSECCDFENCFGDESGESRLARVRRTTELRDVGTPFAV
jgi:nitrogen fixation protein NifQ